MKTIEGYRIVLEVDEMWFDAIARMTEYVEYGELCNWVSSDRLTFEIEEEEDEDA